MLPAKGSFPVNEISCTNGEDLRDNNFNNGGLAIWDGIERMDRKDQFEAEAIAAVSGPGYFALQRLVNKQIKDHFEDQIVPVEWDDILWEQLDQLLMINTVIQKQVKLYF